MDCRIVTGILPSLTGLCSPSQANVGPGQFKKRFYTLLNATKAVAPVVLPTVSADLTTEGHQGADAILHELRTITNVASNTLQNIEHHKVANATRDLVTTSLNFAQNARKHAAKVIGELSDIFPSKNFKLETRESVFPHITGVIEQHLAGSVVVSGDEQKRVVTAQDESPFALKNQQEPK